MEILVAPTAVKTVGVTPWIFHTWVKWMIPSEERDLDYKPNPDQPLWVTLQEQWATACLSHTWKLASLHRADMHSDSLRYLTWLFGNGGRDVTSLQWELWCPFVFYRTRHHGSLRLEPGTEDDFRYALERTSKFAKRHDLLSLPVDALLWIQVWVLLRSSHTHIVAASLTPPVKPISSDQSESKLCGTWPGFIQQGHNPIDMCVTSQTPHIKHPDDVILCEKLCCQRKMLYSSQQSESICCPVVWCSRHPTAKWCSYIYRTLVLLIPSNMIDSHIGLQGATLRVLGLSNPSLAWVAPADCHGRRSAWVH